MTNEHETKLVAAHKEGLAEARKGTTVPVARYIARVWYSDPALREAFVAGYSQELKRNASADAEFSAVISKARNPRLRPE
jgi:hypothetical protein